MTDEILSRRGEIASVETRQRTHIGTTRLHPYILLFFITLGLRVATALPLQQAGYMDASYAMHVAENIVKGRGLVEDVLWNYLDDPTGLPHPSNLYWMPLPSLLIVPFYALIGLSYRVAQIPFLILSLFLPLFSFYLSRRIFGRNDYAWAAAIFTAFSGFYTVYWVSPDNFTVFGLTASLCLYVIARGIETGSVRYMILAGGLAALSHLSRADGILLLAVAPIAMMFHRSTRRVKTILPLTLLLIAAYLVVMAPWFARDYFTVGAIYPSAGTKTLWLTSYDELFRYTDDLTPGRYLAWGPGPILASKAAAAIRNLFILAFGDLQIFLAPFAAIGLWQLRRRLEFLPFFVYAFALYAVMTLAFTFPSWRGSLLHSATALLPFLAVASPPGIDTAIRWVAQRRRTWRAKEASAVFLAGFCIMAVVISLFLYSQGIFGAWTGEVSETLLWNQRDAHYYPVARWLEQNARPEDVVMVVDPPSFYAVSHRRAIMIPTDGERAILDSARRYGARYLILEYDHPKPLDELYQSPAGSQTLVRVAGFQDALARRVILFEVHK